MGQPLTRYITTKRQHSDNVTKWVLSHYDSIDRTLLSEAVRLLGLNTVAHQQWDGFWCKRGFESEREARAYARLKGMPAVVTVWKGDVVKALELIRAGEE